MKIGTSRGHEKSCKEIKQNHTSRKKISLLQSRQCQNRKHGNSYENCNFQTTFHQKQSVSPGKREISRKDSKEYRGCCIQKHKAHGIQKNYKKFAENNPILFTGTIQSCLNISYLVSSCMNITHSIPSTKGRIIN